MWSKYFEVGLVKNKFQIGFEKVQPAGAISYDALSNRYFIYTWNIHRSKHHYGYFFIASIFQPFIVGILTILEVEKQLQMVPWGFSHMMEEILLSWCHPQGY